MKIKLLILLSLFAFLSSSAKEVDVKTAMNIAKKFYVSQSTTQHIARSKDINTSLSHTSSFSTNSQTGKAINRRLYYIFNINSDDGFVIVTADDAVTPILGYSDKGSWNPNNLAPSVKYWMNTYEEQIMYALEKNLEATAEIKVQWNKLLEKNTKTTNTRFSNSSNAKTFPSVNMVLPLLSTTWDQMPNYNAQCPYNYFVFQRTVTGCTATAMAQIMKYWNYPAKGSGFHSYSAPFYGTQSANFGSTTYNWASMPNNVTSANSAVATLMYHCGVSVNMDYGIASNGGSSAFVIDDNGAHPACAENAYKTYFKYDASTIQGLKRNDYTDIAWKNILKNELDNSRPIQYAGFGTGGGHTFVCDGYDINDFFHMNWGWSGSSDGFFDLNALNPGLLSTGGGSGGYNSNQQAVIGIKPISGGNPAIIDLYSSITVNPSPITFAQTFTVNVDVTNSGASNFNGDYCAALFTSTGDFIDIIDSLSTSGNPLQPGYHYTGGLDFVSGGIITVPGSYIIGIFSRPIGGNWNLAGNVSYANPITITIDSPTDYIQQYSTIVTNPTTFVQGQPASVNVDLINDNTATYYGQYQAALYDMSGNFVQTIGTYNETAGLSPGYHYTSPFIPFNCASITAPPSTYILAILELENGFSNWILVGGQYYNTPINIVVVEPALSPDIYESNNTETTAYALPLNWNNNIANPQTSGSNNHIGTDYDYYKINLPSGYNYTITARTHDSYNSGNSITYTNDVLWSYNDGSAWSLAYDDIMAGNILINGGGTTTFQVSSYFQGQTGTYLLDINITRVSAVGINELSNNQSLEIFPNPATNFITVSNLNHHQFEKIRILNYLGETVSKFTMNQTTKNIDITGLTNGIYYIEAIENSNKYSSKFIVNR